MYKTAIITVNYQDSENIILFLQSIMSLNITGHLDIIIADNSSDMLHYQNIVNYIKKNNLNNVHLFSTGANLGYFKAVKKAMDLMIDIKELDFIIVSNNDIIIKDVDFFNKISQIIKKNNIIAPRIISLISNKDQNPHRENPTSNIQKLMYKLLFINFHFGKLLYLCRNYSKEILIRKKKVFNDQERNIFSLHGSFMIFSKSYFEKGGYIDDGCFLYHEEDSVAAICSKIGCNIRFTPQIVVYHNEHKSSNAFGFKKKVYKLQKIAYKYIISNYKEIIYKI